MFSCKKKQKKKKKKNYRTMSPLKTWFMCLIICSKYGFPHYISAISKQNILNRCIKSKTSYAYQAPEKTAAGLEIFFQTNLSCRASAPKNSLVLTKNLLALLLKSENEKKHKINHCFIDTEAKHIDEYG